MPDELIDKGLLTIPLYHGTSNIFLESIRQCGLGGANAIERFAVQQFFEEIFRFSEDVLSGDPEWEACKFAPKLLRDQISYGDSANFQHGDTYLTPSRASAVGYALTNRYGSELISNAYRLLSLVRERCPEFIENSALRTHPLMELFALGSKPVVISLRNVPVEILLGEGGDGPQRALDRLRMLWPVAGTLGVVMNINFRLRRPVPLADCEVKYLDHNSESNPFAW